jgi:hypothetical protein
MLLIKAAEHRAYAQRFGLELDRTECRSSRPELPDIGLNMSDVPFPRR